VIISGLQSCPHWPDTDVYTSRPQTRRDDLMILRLLRPVRSWLRGALLSILMGAHSQTFKCSQSLKRFSLPLPLRS
jgi:hypothetical protein